MSELKEKFYQENISVNLKGNRYQKFSEYKDFFRPGVYVEFLKKTLPRKLIFESTNVCNASCIFCAYQYKKEPNYFMSSELVDEVTEKYATFHPDSFISLTPSFGDSLIDPSIFEKIEICHKNKIKRIQFYTNAILLKKNIDNILSSKLSVLNISLAEFEKKSYVEIYRNNNYETVLEGIHLLLKKLYEKKSDLFVHINFRSPKKIEELLNSKDYKSYIEPFVTDYIHFSDTPEFDNWGGVIQERDLLPGMKISRQRHIDFKIPCRRLFDLQVLPNGDIRTCGARRQIDSIYDDLVIGNIHKQRFDEIWTGEKNQKLASQFFESKVPSLCQDCSLYEAIGAHEKRTVYIKEKRVD